jgi:hypothetical protein
MTGPCITVRDMSILDGLRALEPREDTAWHR